MPINLTGGDEPAITPVPPAAASKIVQKAVSKLTPYPNNPRKNDKAVPAMVDLITKFGFRQPILVKGDEIVDGHLRVKAAKKLELAKVPAIDVGDMSEADIRALRISMNKSAEFADWDFNLLAGEFEALQGMDFNLDLTGFGDTLVTKIIKDASGEAVTTTKSKNADAGSPADPNYVSMSFHTSAANRTNVLNVLNHIRTQKGEGNVSGALVALCKDLADEHNITWIGGE